uniref:Uncharacterized protein n=1 Tax=Candidatus Kentrum sp. SD TaxID=2126332 RepID=A0A451BNM2_9GAMM|nr:MAG: hypothetical protein BECKSD772F_GA0070984_104916 [Candidatus Kentron sp. SD]VFK79837.1 MAG: hypothetical protein BECKSD772D_GA0070982_10691 [Candidatus Kentron sp. SD]
MISRAPKLELGRERSRVTARARRSQSYRLCPGNLYRDPRPGREEAWPRMRQSRPEIRKTRPRISQKSLICGIRNFIRDKQGFDCDDRTLECRKRGFECGIRDFICDVRSLEATFEAKVMINEAWNMTSKTANGPVLRCGRMDKTEGRIRQ